MNVLQELKRIRTHRTILVEDKGGELATLVATVLTILTAFGTGPGIQRLTRLHVLIGGCVNVDAGKIEQKTAMGHRDVPVWQDARKILRDKKACTFIVTCKAQEKLTGTMVKDRSNTVLTPP